MPAVDGVVSGFDTSALITAITDVALVPVVSMRERKGDLEGKAEKITELSGMLQSIADAAGELSTDRGLSSLTSSSTSDLIRVTHDDSLATEGTYDIQVDQQARGETEQSSNFASAGLGEIGHGTLTVTYAGTSHDIVIDSSNDGLDALASAISEQIDGLNATSYDEGTGTDPFRMLVTGETGESNAISFDTSGLAGGALTFGEIQGAQNAQIRVNNAVVQSETDTFTTIPGLTIEVDGVPAGTQRVAVQPDFDTMVDKVQTFVDTYNEAQTFFNVQSVYNADLDIIGPFSGESGLRRVMEGLSTMISASYDTGDGLEGLGQLGIATQKGGTLELDADALRTSLVDNYDAIEGFFTSDDGPLKTLQTRIEDVYVATETGTLESRKDSLEGSVRDLEDSILRQEAYVDSYSERLRKKFTAMEGVMAAMQTQASFLSAMLVTPAS